MNLKCAWFIYNIKWSDTVICNQDAPYLFEGQSYCSDHIKEAVLFYNNDREHRGKRV